MEYDPITGIRELAQAPTPSLLGADIAAYQSPFQRQVTDIALGDIRREAELARQAAQARAIGAGAFGGSRSAILEAEATRPYAEQAARTAATLGQAGFEQAQRAAEADIAREMAGRQFQAGLLGGLQQEQMQRLGMLGDIGDNNKCYNNKHFKFLIKSSKEHWLMALNSLVYYKLVLEQRHRLSTTQQKTGTGDILGTAAQLATLYMMSDERLKENIEYVGKSNGHKVYTWDWNDKAKELGINDPTKGVIAQEVMEYMPEAVSKDANGYYMVNYGAL